MFPLLAGPGAGFTLAGNLTANLVRNVWSFMIIFCGHFPEGTHEFSLEEAANETRGGWYLRQMLGSANLTGGRLFHILSGNLSHQIEHHLFPDIPARRYAEIAVEVRAICERYGLDYNAGPLRQAVRLGRQEDLPAGVAGVALEPRFRTRAAGCCWTRAAGCLSSSWSSAEPGQSRSRRRYAADRGRAHVALLAPGGRRRGTIAKRKLAVAAAGVSGASARIAGGCALTGAAARLLTDRAGRRTRLGRGAARRG